MIIMKVNICKINKKKFSNNIKNFYIIVFKNFQYFTKFDRIYCVNFFYVMLTKIVVVFLSDYGKAALLHESGEFIQFSTRN